MLDKHSHEHTMATLAGGSYAMGSKSMKKAERIRKASVHDDYIVNAQWSNADITTYQHKDNVKNVVIAHRGTDPFARRGSKDLKNDLAIAIGAGDSQRRMKYRTKRTNDIIKALHPIELHLTGHSLGGGTVNYTVANSRLVQKHLTSAHTFNPAAHTLFDNGLKVSKSVKAKLQDKVVHHRIKHDPVSRGLSNNNKFGTVKTYRMKHEVGHGTKLLKRALSHIPGLDWSIKGASAHGLANFTN